MVLAGTPNLEARLDAMDASFWGRAEQFAVGRLDPDAIRAAIRRPLEAEDIRISGDALVRIVHESHGYPFFVQVWGRVVWRRTVGTGSRRVTRADVEAVLAEFEARRDNFYRQRYNELDDPEDPDVLTAAAGIARAFAARPRLTRAELHRSNAVGRASVRAATPRASRRN